MAQTLDYYRQRLVSRTRKCRNPHHRHLRIEPLEDRQLLSITVNTLVDENDGIAVGGISLRDAIAAAMPGDTIDFAPSLFSGGPGTILLTHGELVISRSLTINGAGPALLSIDAQQNSRIFNIDDGNVNTSIDVEIIGMTLTRGSGVSDGGAIFNQENLRVTESTLTSNSGGAIFSQFGNLTVTNSAISGNSRSTLGVGGGIYSRVGDLTISNSTITGNSNNGVLFSAGNVRGNAIISNSTISGNNASGGRGGGIVVWELGNLTITGSTISGNSATRGGGIYNRIGKLTVINSTIAGNTASYGGGIYSLTAGLTTTITASTISGNTASVRGGGIWNVSGRTVISHSTITDNSAASGVGSGVLAWNNTNSALPITEIESTIIAGNTISDVDRHIGSNWFQSSGHNLIGNGNALAAFIQTGDLTGVANPLLGPLSDNGGPTWTHALLPGSQAIDAGDPAAMAGVSDVPLYDQRGEPFGRVRDGDANLGGTIDIGAYEVQAFADPPELLGDYNGNGVVDAADYVVWRKMLGAAVTPYSGADGDGNGHIGQGDYDVWRGHFGISLPVDTETVLALDGVNDYAQGPQSPTLNLAVSSNRYTIEGRFYVPSLSDNQNRRLLTKFLEYDVGIVFSDTSSDFIYFAIYNAEGVQRVTFGANTNLVVGWHHFAATSADSSGGFPYELNIYLDGTRLATRVNVPLFVNLTANPLIIGAAGTGNGGYYSGYIDEVRLSDSVRYTGASYTVPTSPFVADASTRALWHFDETLGSTTFADASGNGNTLTGLNGATTTEPPSGAGAAGNAVQAAVLSPSDQLGVSGQSDSTKDTNELRIQSAHSDLPLAARSVGNDFISEAGFGRPSVVCQQVASVRAGHLHLTPGGNRVARDIALDQLMLERVDRHGGPADFQVRQAISDATMPEQRERVDELLGEWPVVFATLRLIRPIGH
jgi:parallel beta-helix repeat protein